MKYEEGTGHPTCEACLEELTPCSLAHEMYSPEPYEEDGMRLAKEGL